MELKEKIEKLLSTNDFVSLEHLLDGIDIDVWGEKLLDIAYDNESLVAYTLICMMLIKKESPRLHCLASTLLSHSLCHIKGAYSSGFYHMRRAVALDQKNVGYKEALLFFHEIPEQPLDKEEALELAMQVLKQDPKSKPALDVVERYEAMG